MREKERGEAESPDTRVNERKRRSFRPSLWILLSDPCCRYRSLRVATLGVKNSHA